MRNKKIPLLKSMVIASLILSSAYIAFEVPKTAAEAIPTVKQIEARYSDYSPAVSAKGTLIKQEEGWLAIVAVSEADISSIKTGQSAELSGAAFSEEGYSGSIISISDAAYTLQAAPTPEIVIDVTIAIENGDTSLLRSGYSVTARLKTGESRSMITIPYSAIYQDDKGEYVYILKNGAAQRRDIVTGIELSDTTEIISGLSGSEIVICKAEGVEEGKRVRIEKNTA